MSGDLELANQVIASDEAIGAVFVSLSERCDDLLAHQSSIASHLRLIVFGDPDLD